MYDACARTVRLDDGDIRLMATGPFNESDLGVACYHSKVGAVELCLNHLVDGPDEYVVVDMTAGSDSFASGLFTRFDMTFLVAEPTRKGVSVYRQYKEYARDFGVALKVVGNKVQGRRTSTSCAPRSATTCWSVSVTPTGSGRWRRAYFYPVRIPGSGQPDGPAGAAERRGGLVRAA